MKTSIDLIAPASAATAELARFEQITKDAADWIEANYTESLPPIPGPEPTDSDWKVSLLTEALRALPNLIAAHCAAATAKERQARELAEGENARLRDELEAINKREGFIFWLTDDPETNISDPEEAFRDMPPGGHVAEFMAATSLPNEWYACIISEDDEVDPEMKGPFSTEAEARVALSATVAAGKAEK